MTDIETGRLLLLLNTLVKTVELITADRSIDGIPGAVQRTPGKELALEAKRQLFWLEREMF